MPGLADEQEEPPVAGEGVVETGDELGELGLAADERAADASAARSAAAQIESRVLPEDRLVQLTELAAGLDAELLDERAPCRLVGLERLRLAAGAVEAEHQLARADARAAGAP